MNDPIADALGMVPFKREVHEIAPAETDSAALVQIKSDLDTVIGQGITAMQESFEKAGNWQPRDQNKAREVGALLMKATVNALVKKHEITFGKTGTGGPSSPASTPGGTNVNVFTDRNMLIKLLREGGLVPGSGATVTPDPK